MIKTPEYIEWEHAVAAISSQNCLQFHADVLLLYGEAISPVKPGNPEQQTAQQLTALFPPEAKVAVSTNLSKVVTIHPGSQPPQRASTKGVYFKVNALIRPPSGSNGGVCDSDTGFDLVMLELDAASMPAQRSLWSSLIALGLPVVSLTFSGGKSLHAILRVNAATREEYRTCASALLGLLAPFAPDITSKNPSRYTRLAGCSKIGKSKTTVQEMSYLNPDAAVWTPDLPCNDLIRSFHEGLLPLPPCPTYDGGTREPGSGQKRSEAQIKAIRKWAKENPVNGDLSVEDLLNNIGWSSHHKQGVEATEKDSAAWKHFIRCPWADTHTGSGANDGPKDAYIHEWRNDTRFRWTFHCSHNTCQHHGHHIGDFFTMVEQEHPGAIAAATTPWPDLTAEFETLPDDAPEPLGTTEGEADTGKLAELMRSRITEPNLSAAFVAINQSSARFIHDEGEWVLWDQGRWLRDDREQVRQRVKSILAARMKRARGPEEEEALLRFDNSKGIDSLIKYTRSEPAISASSDEFDQDPWVIGCTNGILDLRTGQLSPPTPGVMMRNQVNVAYNPDASCPRWTRHLDETHPGKPEIGAFLQRWFGYCLTGDTSEAKIVVFYGVGRNGKSTIVDALHAIMGDYCGVAAKPLLLCNPKGDDPTAASPAVVDVKGKRIMTLSETSVDAKISEDSIKLLTGGEAITGRRMREGYITFRSQAKIIFSSNHRPRIQGTDEGIWSRMILVKFPESFKGREDYALKETIQSELEGIFAWMVQGCAIWQEKRLSIPPVIVRDTAEYRRDEDIINLFLDENTSTDPDARCPRKDAYVRYQTWVRDSGLKPMSRPNFNRRLLDKGVGTVKRDGYEHWVGFALKEEELA